MLHFTIHWSHALIKWIGEILISTIISSFIFLLLSNFNGLYRCSMGQQLYEWNEMDIKSWPLLMTTGREYLEFRFFVWFWIDFELILNFDELLRSATGHSAKMYQPIQVFLYIYISYFILFELVFFPARLPVCFTTWNQKSDAKINDSLLCRGWIFTNLDELFPSNIVSKYSRKKTQL